MNKSRVTALAVALTLPALVAGCHPHARIHHGDARALAPTDVTCPPSGTCSATLDPVSGRPPENIFTSGGSGRVIVWHIPQHSPLRFDSPGIVFDAPGAGVFRCNPNPTPNGKTVVCRNAGTPSENGYKYTVRLVGREAIDPYVWNF